MPHVATAPILTLCDALVSAVKGQWDTGAAAPNEVARKYQTPDRTTMASLAGRHVWFFPATYSNDPATRGEDLNAYRVGAVVAERFTGAGQPPDSWMDERVDWTETLANDWLQFGRDSTHGLLSIGSREIWTAEMEPVEVYDVSALVKMSMFWAELEFVFGEIA